MRKILLISMLLGFSATLCFASAVRELGRSDTKVLTDNIIKWKEHEIQSYSLKLVYAAGNMPDTLFEIKVKNKKVVSCLRDEMPISDLSGVTQYTIDEMHNSTKKLVRKNKKDAPMLYVVNYDPEYGYITSLVRIYNPKAKAALGKNDYNYRIKVFDFVPEEPVKK